MKWILFLSSQMCSWTSNLDGEAGERSMAEQARDDEVTSIERPTFPILSTAISTA
jgi:hypothetical protein